MSSTSTTQYYGLTQYVGTDKPDFADNNTAFREVDAALHGVVEDAEGFATDIANLQTDVTAAQSNITSLRSDVDNNAAAIVVINNKDLAQDAEIARVDTNSKDMITAYNEASATSTHAYAVGDYFIYNNVLYVATAPIAINDTIVPDTNCSTTNVGAELIQLKSDLVTNTLKEVTIVPDEAIGDVNTNVYQNNNVCDFKYSCTWTKGVPITDWVTLATLPTGSRPIRELSFPAVFSSSGEVNGQCRLRTNGNFDIRVYTGSLTLPCFMSAHCTYLA